MPLNIPGIYLREDYRRGVEDQNFVDRTSGRWAFSGSDLHAYVGSTKIGNLVALTVSVAREVMPLYTFGDPSPRTFVKGKRAITGAMTFTQFDKHALLSTFRVTDENQKDFDTLADLWAAVEGANINAEDRDSFLYNWQQKLSELKRLVTTQPDPRRDYTEYLLRETYKYVAFRQIRYVDQLPPFDLTLVFLNEAGAFAWLSLMGVQFINEGFGYTLNDLGSEIAVTYAATGIRPLSNKPPVKNPVHTNPWGVNLG
jgi:hypothetical protein